MIIRAWHLVLLSCAVLATAFAVVAVTQVNRGVTGELQRAEAQQWFLRDESGRLALELSTYARMDRVDRISREMDMVEPSQSGIVVVAE